VVEAQGLIEPLNRHFWVGAVICRFYSVRSVVSKYLLLSLIALKGLALFILRSFWKYDVSLPVRMKLSISFIGSS
jgi:hypothetical protein